MRTEIATLAQYRCGVCDRSIQQLELYSAREQGRIVAPLAKLSLDHGGTILLSSCGVCASCATTLTLADIFAATRQGPHLEELARRWLATAEQGEGET